MASADRLIEVFNDAKARPVGAERERFVGEACHDEPALKEQVLALLQAHEGAGDFLKHTQLAPPASLLTEKPGDRIGRYKLLQQIGEGGCGVVYMAEQEEPVRRRVALKVIKLGMDTKQVIARFEAERQALALMDHPNIAKVFDAGATEAGRPYFVMELVRGIKITDYCDEANLATRERLGLFMEVCGAIQHAHQKGVIHRDIKPSNILVTINDGVAVPKVIDFGIAKATNQQPLTDKTVFTAFEQFIGTPAYMSPEQAVMTSLDIDTRSDIYSLGVLLYELLTGSTPFDQKELLAAGLDEMRRTILEKKPARPSTRLNTLLAADLTTIATHRHTDAPKLIHLLLGDLDWIVMKALDKDRARRYETANGLAMDIDRHLRDELVIARPPSRLYEFQKTVRRHKFGFAAAAALIAVLAAGVIGTTLGLIGQARESKLARKAELEALHGKRDATAELWRAYLAQARAARFSGQPGRRFDSLEALAKAAAIRFAPELRGEAIACLALPDLKLQRRWDMKGGVFDRALQRYAVPATNFGNISIRQVKDDREVLLLPNPAGAVAMIAAFSHNGKYLPVLCRDHLLRVWDLEQRQVVLTVPCQMQLASVDFEPEDRRVAVAGGAEISIYDLATGEKVNSCATPFAAMCVRYDPPGGKLAISSFQDKRVIILDSSSGAMLRTLTNGSGLGELAWHPREAVLAVPGADNGLIYLWDTAAGRLLHSLKGHQSAPGNVAFSRDGNILISSGWDGTHLWDAHAGEHLMAYGMLYGQLESFAPDGTAYGHSRYLNGPLELLSFASGREAGRWHAAEADAAEGSKVITFSSDGRWLAFGAGDFVKLFGTRTGDLLATLPTGPTAGVCFQKSGGGLVVSGARGLFLWPIRAAGGVGEVTIGPPAMVGSAGEWQQASLSENGEVFAAFHGNHICIFEAEGLREVARTAACGREGQFRVLSVSPDGRRLATGGHHDTVVKIWDSRTGTLVKELADPEWIPEGTPYPAFEPNGGSLIITCFWNYRVWETNSWTPGARVPRPGPDVVVMAPSHQGGVVAMRSGQTSIQLVDVATGAVLATLESPIRSHVVRVAFSPDDTRLAVTHWGTRELLVWDLRLLRQELANMGMDWARPPFPPEENLAPLESNRITVLGQETPVVTGPLGEREHAARR